MDSLELYEIAPQYIAYLSTFETHLFRNKKIHQNFSRKYVGIIFSINGFDYFAPLSSFKEKHKRLSETVDFIKIGSYAVINLNNMFPAPKEQCTKIDIAKLNNVHYKSLVRAEYRIIRQKTELIISNARSVYDHKWLNDGKSKLSRRCNDFRLLEEKCADWKTRSEH